ncbi:DUF1176 domain-containing protein [Sphingorhabdus sp.]|uniref:DUF1176 domain-containing protein n=1 Tax=Sphingorhabdus sp. TaxID=1902408 RepID=UPI00391D8832
MHKTFIWLAFLAATILPAFHAAAAVTPGKVQIYKDWAVGCDNGLDCQAVALQDDKLVEQHLSVVVTRTAGASTSLIISISSNSLEPGRYLVRVDNKTLTRDVTKVLGQPIQVTDAAALNLARAMARGNTVRLLDDTGNELGKASLAGASAAFRYIDAQQSRAGVRNAIVAISGKPKTGRRPALPVITARRIRPDNVLPDTASLIALSDSNPCGAERFESSEDTAFSLGIGGSGPQALVLVTCGRGAYNVSSGIYTARRDKKGAWTFEPTKFDYGATGFTAESGIPILVNTRWDPAAQTISTYNKARGLGDCGSSASYVWDGQMFRMISASFMGECRGSSDWIPTWRAEVRLTP